MHLNRFTNALSHYLTASLSPCLPISPHSQALVHRQRRRLSCHSHAVPSTTLCYTAAAVRPRPRPANPLRPRCDSACAAEPCFSLHNSSRQWQDGAGCHKHRHGQTKRIESPEYIQDCLESGVRTEEVWLKWVATVESSHIEKSLHDGHQNE